MHVGALVLCGGLLSCTCRAQHFQNLDFENPGTQLAPDGIWLSWNLAVPGWNHPKGGDSLFVYHKSPPLDSIAQFYFLVDETSTQWSPLEGNRSLALVSGHYNRNDANSPWVSAYIEQQAFVPENAETFHVMATGDFSLSLNEQSLPVSRLGENQYVADVSAYAGQYVTLRVANEATEIQTPVIVDKMEFSTHTVPEPGTPALMLMGLAVLAGRKLRKEE